MAALKGYAPFEQYLSTELASSRLPVLDSSHCLHPGEVFCRAAINHDDGSQEICGSRLSSTNNLRKHLQSVHPDLKNKIQHGTSGKISTDTIAKAKVFYKALVSVQPEATVQKRVYTIDADESPSEPIAKKAKTATKSTSPKPADMSLKQKKALADKKGLKMPCKACKKKKQGCFKTDKCQTLKSLEN